MVRIVGGGFSALTLAEALAEKGIAFEIFESSSSLGGLLQTESLQFGISESAANGLLWSPELQALCDRLSLKLLEKKKSARNRWIFANGKPRRWPLGFLGTLSLLKGFLIFKFFPRKLLPKDGQSLRDYGLSHFGSEVTLNLIRPALHGIYGPLFRELSANLVLGKFFDPHRRKIKPRTVSFSGGLKTLIDALGARVSAKGKIHLNRKISLPELALNSGPVILCTGLSQSLELLRERYPDAMPSSRLLSSGLISVTLILEARGSQLKGFGCLFGDLVESEGILGVLFNSDIFDHRVKGNLRSETWILDLERHRDRKDSDLLSLIKGLRENFLDCPTRVLESKFWRWPGALPVYSQDLEKWLDQLGPFGERALAGTPVRIHGNFMGEIGLASILQRSQLLADKIERMV